MPDDGFGSGGFLDRYYGKKAGLTQAELLDLYDRTEAQPSLRATIRALLIPEQASKQPPPSMVGHDHSGCPACNDAGVPSINFCGSCKTPGHYAGDNKHPCIPMKPPCRPNADNDWCEVHDAPWERWEKFCYEWNLMDERANDH